MPLHANDDSLLTSMKQKESNLTHVLNVLFVYKEEANASGVPVTIPRYKYDANRIPQRTCALCAMFPHARRECQWHASDGSLLKNMMQIESNNTNVLNVVCFYKQEANASDMPMTVPW